MWKLQSCGNLTLGDIINNWLERPGFPVVNIKEDGHGHITAFTTVYDRFTDQDLESTATSMPWRIPLHYSTPTKDNNLIWIDNSTGEYTINLLTMCVVTERQNIIKNIFLVYLSFIFVTWLLTTSIITHVNQSEIPFNFKQASKPPLNNSIMVLYCNLLFQIFLFM